MKNMEKTIRHNELLTEEVQEIISHRPHWIVRRGNTLFFLILLLLLGLTWLVQYPDKINASAKLVAVNPPMAVNSRVAGKLAGLFVTNGQAVQKNQTLGCLESTADYKEVIQLQGWINEVISNFQNKD
jgi:HlyD family secretion protein